MMKNNQILVEDIIIYELFNKNYREKINITEFEDIIKDVFKDISHKLKIIVTSKYFVIINRNGIYERDIIERVRQISKYKEAQEYIVSASKIPRLFKRTNAKRRKADIVDLLNTYYSHGGTL